MTATEVLLDGGPADGRTELHWTSLESPEVIVEHDGVKHVYRPAEGPVADEWLRNGTALYSWGGPL